MKLTKDEARLLAHAVDSYKYDREIPDGMFEVLEKLQSRLEHHGQDNRRNGRTSMNDYSDLCKRLILKNQ